MELFDSGSWARLRHLLERIAAGERDATALVHVSPQRTSETLSYRCSAISIGDGRFLLLGEPQMPLAVHEYVQVIDELSSATRQLHRARHELLHKQSRLEEALKRMSELAQMDELTRTLNRRAIMERLREEIDRAHRYGAPLTVMMIDIDHFKQVNDRFGHPEGDHVLRDVAELLRTSIRVSDQIGRYGGEEFLVLLPETTVPAAADLAERLRRTIIDATFVLGEFVQHRVTISAGLAALTDTSETIDRLLMHADNALYTAKADGRNCWRAWAPPKQSEAAH
jgi:diguanylate cyclase (GGDEF)-like protein